MQLFLRQISSHRSSSVPGSLMRLALGGGEDYPFFTKAWLDKPCIEYPLVNSDKDVIYLADSAGNVYSVINYYGRGYLTFNATVVTYESFPIP